MYNDDFELYAFEANPNLVSQFQKVDNLNLYQKAVWIEDGTMQFYLGSALSSTLLKNKKTGGIRNDHFIYVECIDLDAWIRKNFSKQDNIILLMDIEGAEYDIIDKMNENGSLDYINKFYLEFHGDKLKEFDIQREYDIMNMLIEKFEKNIYIYRQYQHEEFQKLNHD